MSRLSSPLEKQGDASETGLKCRVFLWVHHGAAAAARLDPQRELSPAVYLDIMKLRTDRGSVGLKCLRDSCKWYAKASVLQDSSNNSNSRTPQSYLPEQKKDTVRRVVCTTSVGTSGVP